LPRLLYSLSHCESHEFFYYIKEQNIKLCKNLEN
jgi:hypothetical protein